MIVTAPNDFAADIHDRMPVFLTEEQFSPWLSGEAGAEYLKPRSTTICIAGQCRNASTARRQTRRCDADQPSGVSHHLGSHASIATLIAQRLEYGAELLTFSRVWIDFPRAIRHPYVIRPHLLFEVIEFVGKGFELLRVAFLLRFIERSCSLAISQ